LLAMVPTGDLCSLSLALGWPKEDSPNQQNFSKSPKPLDIWIVFQFSWCLQLGPLSLLVAIEGMA
jgi:hypothetical protein